MKRPVLQYFVEHHQEKAVEILIKCCHDRDIEKDIVEYLLDEQLQSKNNTGNNDRNVAPAPKRSFAAQRTGLFSSNPRHDYAGTGTHAEPPSPPKTRSNHSKSLFGKDGREAILILAMNEDDDIDKLPATMMLAPIEYSVINEQMFDTGRICDSNIEEIDEEEISVPRRGAPGLLSLTVSSRAKLTWKRSKSNASHMTVFYLVNQEFLDVDILLGSLDSGEDMPEVTSPPPQKGRVLSFRETLDSFHRSAESPYDFKVSARVQPDELIKNFVRTQRKQVAAQSRSISTAALKRPDTSEFFTHMKNPHPGSDRIRVSCTLNSSTLSFWLDLDSSAQEFFMTLHKEFEKKKKCILDRATMSILFTYDKTSNDDGREIQLSEDELEADWEETVEWLRDNKRQKSPHIYAAVHSDPNLPPQEPTLLDEVEIRTSFTHDDDPYTLLQASSDVRPGVDFTSPAIACLCSSPASSKLFPGPTSQHVLNGLAGKLPDAWEEISDQLPESYRWDIEYVPSYDHSKGPSGCWTCAPLKESGFAPLTIAKAPVVLPVEHQWPPVGGINPPPDPRPSARIDCWAELPMDTIRDIFLTFESSFGFYILISGLLQIIVDEAFDTTWASSHLPHRYGGLKVCYIMNTMEPTMMQSNAATTAGTGARLHIQPSRVFSKSKQARSTQSLKLNDFIEARVSSTSREKFAGRIGLKVEKDGQPYLVMSSHIITEAILNKSFFGLSRDPVRRLKEDWNKNAEIWAGNSQIGTIERSYDQAAEYYPNGFNHDVTLIRPTTTISVAEIKSPVNGIGWLDRDSWSSLRQQSSALKILSSIDTNRAAKCIKCNTPSEAVIVGEGIFLNQTAAAGAKPARNHDLSTWNRLVSRAVLYRVSPDFSPSTGHSGIALYAEGLREDGTQGPGIVGFQSFVQMSNHPQKFNMPEGPHLGRRLKEGRVAFYGAFQVPDELRREYSIL